MAATEQELAAARESGRVEARLDGHEARLNTINGSIGRSAKAQEDLKDEVAELRLVVVETNTLVKERELNAQKAASEVHAELVAAEDKASNERGFQVSKRQLQIGALGLGIALLELTARLFGVSL